MKKVPRWVYVLLWGLVALRLILPFSIESPISLMPRTDWVIEDSIQGQVPSVDIELLPDSPPAAESTEFEEPPAVPAPPPVTKSEGDREIHIPFVLSCVWIAGVVGMLAEATVSGFLMAIFMSNSGGAWDNAKKYIESGAHGGKGSNQHKAAVVGDTVGDPFKDTSGPAINILIKLLSMVSIVFAAVVVKYSIF